MYRAMFFVNHVTFLLRIRDNCGIPRDMISINLLCQLVAERSIVLFGASDRSQFPQSFDMLFCSLHSSNEGNGVVSVYPPVLLIGL